jgi:hypothetical protein
VIRDERTAELQKWLPSDWIKQNEPRKSPYHPQVSVLGNEGPCMASLIPSGS